MAVISFWGSSDDLIEVDGDLSGCDEYMLTDFSTWIGVIEHYDSGDKIKVYAYYDGCWAFGVGIYDEGHKMPEWPVNFVTNTENNYSVRMGIEVPDDAEVYQYGKG